MNATSANLTDLTVSAAGSAVVGDGAIVENLYVFGGDVDIKNGGTATGTITVQSTGIIYASAGGVANGAIVNLGGYFYVYDGSIVSETHLVGGGELHVMEGGSAVDVIMDDYSYITVSSGATVTIRFNPWQDQDFLLNSQIVNNGGSVIFDSPDGYVYIGSEEDDVCSSFGG